jgi:hypothetical protein
VVVRQDVAGRVDDDPGSRAALLTHPDLERDDGGHRAGRDVGHRPRRALPCLDGLADRGVRVGEAVGPLGGEPPDQAARGADEHRDERQHGEGPRLDPTAEEHLAQAEPGTLTADDLAGAPRLGRGRPECCRALWIPPRVALGALDPERVRLHRAVPRAVLVRALQ